MDDLTQISFACENGRDGHKMTLGGIRNDLRECRLARTWRSPQDDRGEESISFDGAAQKLALPNDVFLTDILIQRARTHTRGKRRFGPHAFLQGMVEEISHSGDYSIFENGVSTVVFVQRENQKRARGCALSWKQAWV